MLEHHPLLDRRLRKKGRRAFATVLRANRTSVVESLGDTSIFRTTRVLHKLVVRAVPEGEPPFEATLEAWFGELSGPWVGEQFSVLYHPDDHSRVMLDPTEEGEKALVDYMTRQRAQERARRIRTSAQVQTPARANGAHEKGAHASRSADYTPTAGAAAAAEAPVKFADLHDRGVLTAEEFRAQKQKVLCAA
jgi:hypothetical protein